MSRAKARAGRWDAPTVLAILHQRRGDADRSHSPSGRNLHRTFWYQRILMPLDYTARYADCVLTARGVQPDEPPLTLWRGFSSHLRSYKSTGMFQHRQCRVPGRSYLTATLGR